MTYRLSIQVVRPSGHKPTGAENSFTRHAESFECAHQDEHVYLYLRLLDVVAYDCGIRKGEFPPLHEDDMLRTKELIERLYAVLPEEYRVAGKAWETYHQKQKVKAGTTTTEGQGSL